MSVRYCIAIWCAAGLFALGCGSDHKPSSGARDAGTGDAADTAPEIPAECLAVGQAPELLPNVEAHHLTLAFWLEHLAGAYDLDEELLTPEDIRAMNSGLGMPREKYHSQHDLLAPVDHAKLAVKVEDRRTWAREKLSSGGFVRDNGARFRDQDLAIFDVPTPPLDRAPPQIRVALDDIPIRCAMMPGSFYSPSLDMRIDRNACSTVRAQDIVRLVALWPNGMQLVQSRYSFGWIPVDAPLSPPVPEELLETFVHGTTLQVVGGDIEFSDKQSGLAVVVPEGARVPAADERGGRGAQAYVATAAGFVTTPKKAHKRLRSTHRGLTRRALLEEAWRYMNTPYGMGDTNGGRDCSRLIMDVFESFDLHLPRHSSWMARAGTFWIDVADDLPEDERLRLIEAAAQKGVVLLSFPGHIMLYLGRNENDVPMVLHAFREYLVPCAESASKMMKVPSVTVSDLELGRGTERRAFIERIDRITVIGKPPGAELGGAAQLRPVGEAAIPSDRSCRDSRTSSLFVSPLRPHRGSLVHVIAALSDDPGPAAFTLVDPDGQRVEVPSVQLGGPPYGRVATLDQPRPGRWKAVLADGNRVLACQRFYVRWEPDEPAPPSEGPIWQPLNKWTPAMENLYSLFIERLFDYPFEEDLVWPNLHTLLQDRERNILYDHRAPEEDAQLVLQPDCADLPYTLRAYFAWKMRLPFGYRRCTRAREGKPPECDREGEGDNLINRLELEDREGVLLPRDDVSAFLGFVHTRLQRAVHSSSGRTHPDDDLTDFYPVPLTREALRPGTVFTDPYGHLLVVSDWIPQGVDSYGILVGADAQPDGTVGRRRFWRGSFLFRPDVESGGAGFKAFRPREYIAEPEIVDVDAGGVPTQVSRPGWTYDLINEDLEKSRFFTRYSKQQYEGSLDDFYNRVEALINPRPLDPRDVQRSLIDALAESIARRVNSIDNGEQFMASKQPGYVMDMPEGASIFLTSGPWEDFSTPSRDLRLLISIDSVVGFPRSVREAPQRFGLRPDQVQAAASEVQRLLDKELAARSFQYTRSDGSPHTLTLADVVARSERFEMAYNPNDCAELRWGAPPESEEASTCSRRKPAEQAQKMQEYRHWFATRSRPPQ